MFKRLNVLIIDWNNCPENVQEVIKGYHAFQNDCYLDFLSEFNYIHSGETDLSKQLTRANIEEYWQDQKKINGFKGSFEEFVKEYGLQIEMWLLDQDLDLTGVEKILFKICW
jgi:hypothetical protein